MSAGMLLPPSTDGHCGYDPTNVGEICGQAATLHAWIGGQHDPDAYTIYACPEHEGFVMDAVKPLDWHECSPDCIATKALTWIFSGTPGDSFCMDQHLGLEQMALAAADSDGAAR